jgi:protein O-mannosyl-transferase
MFPSWLILLVVALVTFSAFVSTLDSDFVNWDDPALLLQNVEFRGLGWTHLQWMFTTTLMGHWVPLTWVTFGLDYVLWGLNPLGYHLTNLLFHTAAVVAFYFVALRLLRAAMAVPSEIALRLGAGAAALFFAIHPLRVESVAWITERRDVLSGLFFMLTILTYLKAAAIEGRRRRWWLVASLGCYLLAVLSKGIVMTLPLVLIILDFYPLRRIGGNWREWVTPWARRIWLEKIPYFVLALVAGGMAAFAQRTIVAPLTSFPLASRIGVAFYGLWFYVQKTVVPYPIWPLYENYPDIGPLSPAIVGGALGVIALSIGFFRARRRWPAGVVVWVSYVVLLAPVSGLTQAGPQLVAPRYSYLACLGWALLVGAASCLLVQRIARGRLHLVGATLCTAGMVAAFGTLIVLTRNQSRVWRNSEMLWSYALAGDPKSPIAHNNLGSFLINRGRVEEGEAHIKKAVELRPGYKDAVRNLGGLAVHGRLDDSARNEVAFKLVKVGDFDRAAVLFRKAVEERPADATAHNNLGVALLLKRDSAAAIEQFEQALKINPRFEEAKLNLGAAEKKR